ncbi:hypothetical protein LA080_013516 [Diaporthe eres]|nr:hypothetical protein LA080_013516 [Diaporthe eres]
MLPHNVEIPLYTGYDNRAELKSQNYCKDGISRASQAPQHLPLALMVAFGGFTFEARSKAAGHTVWGRGKDRPVNSLSLVDGRGYWYPHSRKWDVETELVSVLAPTSIQMPTGFKIR